MALHIILLSLLLNLATLKSRSGRFCIQWSTVQKYIKDYDRKILQMYMSFTHITAVKITASAQSIISSINIALDS
jgi:hypothetical protein